MSNLNPVNEVPKCKIWRRNRVDVMVKEMGEHGINGKVTTGIGNDWWWEVSFADFDDKDKLTQHVNINCCHENGYEMVQAAYMATLQGRG